MRTMAEPDASQLKDTTHSRWLRRSGVAAVLLAFVACAAAFISLPGLYYDETLFVNAAVGGPTESFVHWRFMGVPVMLMPYIGALKAFIYYPIFRLWGVSPTTIRLPAILISTATLFLAYDIGKRLFRPGLAIGLLLLMASDPAFIFQSKLDWGPVVVGCFLKLLALRLFFDFLVHASFRTFAGLVVVLALGIFDKANFVWIVNALIIASIVAYGRRLWHIARRQPLRSAIAASALAAVLLLSWEFLIAALVAERGEAVGLTRLPAIGALAVDALNGKDVWFLTRLESIPRTSAIFPAFAVALVVLALNWALRSRQKSASGSGTRPPANGFFAVVMVMLFVQMAFTPNAIGPHHMLVLWPLHHFLIAGAASAVVDRLGRRGSRAFHLTLGPALAGAAFALVIGSQIGVTLLYLQSYASGRGFKSSWDPAIYRLSEMLERSLGEASVVISADWGIDTQIRALAPAERRRAFRDAWPWFIGVGTPAGPDRAWLRAQITEPGVLIVTHSKEATVFPATRANLVQFAQEQRLQLDRIDLVTSVDGLPLYEVYRVRDLVAAPY